MAHSLPTVWGGGSVRRWQPAKDVQRDNLAACVKLGCGTCTLGLPEIAVGPAPVFAFAPAQA